MNLEHSSGSRLPALGSADIGISHHLETFKSKALMPFHKRHDSKRSLHQAGFSFLEFLVVIALMATVYAVAIPNLNILSTSSVESKISQLTSDIRAAYDLSVLKQKPHRMVFMLMSGEYWLETTDRDDFTLGNAEIGRDYTAAEEQELSETFDTEFEEYVDLAGSEIEDSKNERVLPPMSPVVLAKDRLKPVKWTMVKNAEWKKRTIGPDLIIQDMRAFHHDRKQTFEDMLEEARAMIYFFPTGYVEKAYIHIAYRKGEAEFDDTEPPYTLITKPYEGVAEVTNGYEEIELYDER